ncbi:Uma2 family endonuclease [Lewinella sp. LCG006]|uniref:Uma2 family endonuclease n=1 Tax=Lewinella sp. LCG006 TaxID=3231911 RepID=UPI00345F3386
MANNSEPEPDLAIVKYRKDYYATAHPGPEDILLLIEVADTSLAKDRHVKSVLFAESNIPEYWIMNTEEDLIRAISLS